MTENEISAAELTESVKVLGMAHPEHAAKVIAYYMNRMYEQREEIARLRAALTEIIRTADGMFKFGSALNGTHATFHKAAIDRARGQQ